MALHADVLPDVVQQGAQLEQLPVPAVETVKGRRTVEEVAAARRLTLVACASFQPQRRHRPSTDSRRIARGSPLHSAREWRPMASSTIPSRSAHSQPIELHRSRSGRGRSSTSKAPAGSRSARRASTPGSAARSAEVMREQVLGEAVEFSGRDRQLVDRRRHRDRPAGPRPAG